MKDDYNLNPFARKDAEERAMHIEEKNEALSRLEQRRKHRNKVFICCASGVLIAILYTVYISLKLPYIFHPLVQDFVIPIALNTVIGFILGKGFKDKLSFSIIGILICTILILLGVMIASYL